MADQKRYEGEDDLSSFAMPHLASSDRVLHQMHLEDKVQSVDSMQGDTFSTPPNSPPILPKVSSSSQDSGRDSADKDSMTSYEKAITTDSVWEPENPDKWKEERKTAMPKHITSPVKQQLTPSSPPADLLPGYPKVEIVSTNPASVRVGFLPTSVETTNPAELPGSQRREEVITTPPHSSLAKKPVKLVGSASSSAPGGAQRVAQNRNAPPVIVHQPSSPRTKSIEEADKEREKYAPQDGEALDEVGKLKKVEASPKRGKDIRKSSVTPSEYSTISLAGSIEESIEADRLASLVMSAMTEDVCAEVMSANTCYNLIPSSTKIVVFDTRLKVKKAFFALVANGVRAAPLWEHSTQGFVGMLTITDFINILRHHYKSPIVGMDELENQTIRMWRDSEKSVTTLKSSLVQIDPEQSLYDAVKMLVDFKIHRLPIIDKRTGNALYILTHKRLLHFLYTNFLEKQQPTYMHKSIGELGIGTFKNIATASESTPIILALNTFHEKRVSALPIVDAEGKAVDIYAKFDVINLAAERSYGNLDITLKQALLHRSQTFEQVHTCLLSESVFTIVQRLVTIKVHRLIVVNKDQVVIGVVSLSDILKFLVLTPHE